MQIYRARAYRSTATPEGLMLPDVTVFFEAVPQANPCAVLQQLLALCWGCSTTEVAIDALHSAADLYASSRCGERAGMVRLFESGWGDGPLFVDQDKVLLMGRPATVHQLDAARERSRTWREHALYARHAGWLAERPPTPPALRRRSDLEGLS